MLKVLMSDNAKIKWERKTGCAWLLHSITHCAWLLHSVTCWFSKHDVAESAFKHFEDLPVLLEELVLQNVSPAKSAKLLNLFEVTSTKWHA
jgi:hypothetical protein